MIAEGVLAMEFSASDEDMARQCHATRTLSAAVGEAARGAAFATWKSGDNSRLRMAPGIFLDYKADVRETIAKKD